MAARLLRGLVLAASHPPLIAGEPLPPADVIVGPCSTASGSPPPPSPSAAPHATR